MQMRDVVNGIEAHAFSNYYIVYMIQCDSHYSTSTLIYDVVITGWIKENMTWDPCFCMNNCGGPFYLGWHINFNVTLDQIHYKCCLLHVKVDNMIPMSYTLTGYVRFLKMTVLLFRNHISIANLSSIEQEGNKNLLCFSSMKAWYYSLSCFAHELICYD